MVDDAFANPDILAKATQTLIPSSSFLYSFFPDIPTEYNCYLGKTLV